MRPCLKQHLKRFVKGVGVLCVASGGAGLVVAAMVYSPWLFGGAVVLAGIYCVGWAWR